MNDIRKCMGCGIEKDMAVPEQPLPDDDFCFTDPLLEINLHDLLLVGWNRYPLVCHACFRNLDPDMWISRRCWDSLNPVVSADDLPRIRNDK